jgi:hypothetical protein
VKVRAYREEMAARCWKEMRWSYPSARIWAKVNDSSLDWFTTALWIDTAFFVSVDQADATHQITRHRHSLPSATSAASWKCVVDERTGAVPHDANAELYELFPAGETEMGW